MKATADPTAMSAEANIKTLRDALEALETEGLEAWNEHVLRTSAVDVEFAPIGVPGSEGEPLRRGTRAVILYFQELDAEMPGFYYADPIFEAFGEDVVIADLTVVTRGEGGPTLPTIYVVYEFTGGLISRVFPYEARENAVSHAEEVAGA